MAKITSIRTIRIAERSNILWVEIETDEGLTGTGEAFRGADAVESVIHNQMSSWLLGQDSRRIELISRTLTTPYVGFASASAEIRAASAIDIALWDLCGKRHGIPVHQALGGASRDVVPVYNTCAGYAYNTSSSSFNAGTARRVIGEKDAMRGPYDDQIAFMNDAGALAESLLAEGYRGMKIWPFDAYAVKTQGTFISLADLEAALEPFRKIREAVGNRIEIMAELHSMWNVQSAIRICRALEEYAVFWAEDPICKMDDIEGLADIRSKTKTPLCGSETLAGLSTYRRMFAHKAVDIAMLDLGWCGGLTQGRKISALAEANGIAITPHDCTGPISLWAGVHLAFHSPVTLFQEVVRAVIATWYRDLVDALPVIAGGGIELPRRSGLGVALRPETAQRADATVVVSR
ncbi:Mandelate racemase/muconate lactonizing enzyme protein [uncultured delta proteobacterium]|uniref:Mandelate racemase/muconate lactonizing enzyme protein n=1 Tax=uncultured delta proteobacterium TaxID=34034 RepID=A0A212KAT9_9DELT|nr:Mandelate racemase/muconate lactonizing enzyme protein [uncultured delta proteobacterium]